MMSTESEEWKSDKIEEIARVKMEHHASFLVKQVEMIEAVSRSTTSSIRDAQSTDLNCLFQHVIRIDSHSNDTASDRLIAPNTLLQFDSTQPVSAKDNDSDDDDDNNDEGITASDCVADIDDKINQRIFQDIHYETDEESKQPCSGFQIHQSPNPLKETYSSQQIPFDMGDIKSANVEINRLRESLRLCCDATIRIQKNVDLKNARLQFEVAHLRQQLAMERSTNSKLTVLNLHLKQQIEATLLQTGADPNSAIMNDLKSMRQREKTVEKHLNYFIASRNQAIKESTILKKKLASACFECRQKLNVKRLNPVQESPHGGCNSVEDIQVNDMLVGDVETIVAVVAETASQTSAIEVNSLNNDVYLTVEQNKNILYAMPEVNEIPRSPVSNTMDPSNNRDIMIDFSEIVDVPASVMKQTFDAERTSRPHLHAANFKTIPVESNTFNYRDIPLNFSENEMSTRSSSPASLEDMIMPDNFQRTTDNIHFSNMAVFDTKENFIELSDVIETYDLSTSEAVESSRITIGYSEPLNSTDDKGTSMKDAKAAPHPTMPLSKEIAASSPQKSLTSVKTNEGNNVEYPRSSSFSGRNGLNSSKERKKGDAAKWRRRFQAGVFGRENES